MKNSSASPVSSASPAPSRAPCSSRTAPASAEARSAPVPVQHTRQKRRISFFRGALTATLLLFCFSFRAVPERYVPVCPGRNPALGADVLPAVFPFSSSFPFCRITGGAEKVSRALLPVSRALFGTGGAGGFCFFMSISFPDTPSAQPWWPDFIKTAGFPTGRRKFSPAPVPRPDRCLSSGA